MSERNGVTYVCPLKDIICGSIEQNWCDECPLRRTNRPVVREPHLGLATTKELIDELAARASVSETVGEAWPSYWTAIPDKR